MKYYLGVDIGSISTKAVIIDEHNTIVDSCYIWTEGNPIKAVKEVICKLKHYNIVSVGTTGSARKLIGTILNATIIKNEITAHAVGTLNLYPNARTILEIGGQDSKIILLNNGIITDYAMNTLCAAGTGSFLSSQSRRLNIPIEDFGSYAIKSAHPTNIAARCTVFAESDLIHKAGMGYKTEDIIAGLCQAIVGNYLNNVGKGKKIEPPVIFQGGVSKNIGVVKAFEEALHTKIIVDSNSHLMGAYGVAILAHRLGKEKLFSYNIKDINFNTKGVECYKCPNHCEIVCVYNDNKLLDSWGNRCDNGLIKTK